MAAAECQFPLGHELLVEVTMRLLLRRKTSVDEAEILRDEFDELLQDQLTELRPLKRRSKSLNNSDVSLSVKREENNTGMPTIVKIGS
ncbi:MAG: hypothetical protein ABJD13_08635 [Paracoccaceae bacterium]